jgi:NAD(P)-dependent dehydrogenase (short-subunit alcohol dehydrogenase family)
MAPRGARVLAATVAAVPADPWFKARAPWRVGLVQTEAGPQALVHLAPGLAAGDAVRLTLVVDRAGAAVLHAAAPGGDPGADPQWQAMVAHPRGRRVLVTDARHVCALPLVRALFAAGAAEVFAGVAEGWKPCPAAPALEAAGARLVALDVTSDRSVEDSARDLGGRVDILVNTADRVRPGGGAAEARAAMETVAFGLARLARAFGPAMAARAGAIDGSGAAAWVTVLSIYGRAAPPALAGYGAAHAAALALAAGLRGDLGRAGLRVATVLAGPTEDAWWDAAPPPRATGRAIADAVMAALTEGLEEVAAGDIARDLMARLDENPRAVERALARGEG